MAEKKIKPITEKELIEIVNREGLGAGHPFETELCLHGSKKKTMERKQEQLPGTIGVTRTASGEYWMAYCVDENRKMTKCSVHNTREESLGMALRRYRESAKEPEYEKPEGNSFHYGPLSEWKTEK